MVGADEGEDGFGCNLRTGDATAAYDVASRPGPNADSAVDVARYISPEVLARYEVHSYRHAASILANEFPRELADIQDALMRFSITPQEIGMPGGNESDIPKKISGILRPRGWLEARIRANLVVSMEEFDERMSENRSIKYKVADRASRTMENYIDGHKIDYVKGRVAFDLEWNSKDQTFDRDLYAFRTFHECGLISAGVMLTRSGTLNPVFRTISQLTKSGLPELHTSGKRSGTPKTVEAKYGASTTWMGKLLYRLNAGRHGGCPVLVFGITPQVIEGIAET